jgi:hypothetical protein
MLQREALDFAPYAAYIFLSCGAIAKIGLTPPPFGGF